MFTRTSRTVQPLERGNPGPSFMQQSGSCQKRHRYEEAIFRLIFHFTPIKEHLERLVPRGRLRAGRGHRCVLRGHRHTPIRGSAFAFRTSLRDSAFMHEQLNVERLILTSGGASNRVPRSSHVRNLLPPSTGTEPPPLGQSSFSSGQKKKLKKIQVCSWAV